MQNQQQNSPGTGISLDDIYYVLFRHKWKIVILSLVGIIGADVIYHHKPPEYQSEAELLIRYVDDNTSSGPEGTDRRVESTDPGAESVINSEMEILSSLDTAKRTVDEVGAEKILAKAGGGKDPIQAAGFIKDRLKVYQLPKSSVIVIQFRHPDSDMVQPILSQVIDQYLKKHQEIHEGSGTVNDFLRRETDRLRGELNETETELRKTRSDVGVISTEDAMKSSSESIDRTSQQIREAEAELADRRAAYNALSMLSSRKPAVAVGTNASVEIKPEPEVPETVIQEYNQVNKRLVDLWASNEDLRHRYSAEAENVKENRDLIDKAEAEKQELERKNPGLKMANSQNLISKLPLQPEQRQQQADPAINLAIEEVKIAGLQSRITTLNSQLNDIRTNADKIAQVGPKVVELEQKKELQMAQLKSFAKSLEDSRIEEGFGAGKVPNISKIQEPSPPGRDWKKRYKAMEMLAIGGLFGGIAWAFLIEFYLDTSVKRPKEVKTKLGMPLFLSIPNIRKNGHGRLAPTNGQKSLPDTGQNSTAVIPNGSAPAPGQPEVAPWEHSHSLRPYYESLRERLIGYFEAKNLTHNPKLVALTGCSKGSGATTLAMGLAASLSETGEGNVLLVDMNQEQGAAQHFYRGRPHCGLDELLENGSGNRDDALVQDKLYVVSANSNGDKLPCILPKRFASLLPKLKSSDYDYIIFDMPPVSQISVTLRLAGFMDAMLLVVESEKTKRDTVMEAASLLAEANANVSVVLNKTRSYIPNRLQQGF